MNKPDLLANSFTRGMGDAAILEQEELPELADAIGDKSGGTTLLMDMEGITMGMDLLLLLS